MQGEVRIPRNAGNHFDAKNGLIYRKDGRSPGDAAIMWNLQMKYSLSGCKPSSPPTLLDEIAVGKVRTYNFAHTYLDENGFYRSSRDDVPLPNELVIWNQRMKAAYSINGK